MSPGMNHGVDGAAGNMAEPFSIEVGEREGVPLIRVTGCLSQDGGNRVLAIVGDILGRQENKVIFDLAGTTVITSPAVADLLDAAVMIVQDNQGLMILTGLNAFKAKMLSLVGLTRIAKVVDTVEQGVALAKG